MQITKLVHGCCAVIQIIHYDLILMCYVKVDN